MPATDTDGAIHTYFELSYSTHLVIDPVACQGLPASWHQQVDGLLAELHRGFAHVRQPVRYLARAGRVWEYGDLSPQQMRALNITTNREDLHANCGCPPPPEEDPQLNDETWNRRVAWLDQRWQCEYDQLRWYDANGDERDRQDRLVVAEESELQAERAGRTVVPRTLLQSMPVSWQDQFVALLGELPRGSSRTYDIVAQVYRAGRWETIADPVPHYQRGRTYLEPRLEVQA